MWKTISIITIASQVAFANVITLADCYKSFQIHNKSLLEAKAQWQASHKLYQAAKGVFWPQIKSTLSASKGELDGTPIETTNQFGLVLNQNLFGGFSDTSNVDQFEEKAKISHLRYLQTRQKVWIQIQQSFALVEYHQDFLKAAQQNLMRRNENFKMVELRYSSGRENKGSLILSQAYYEQAKLELASSEKALLQSQRTLSELIGVQVSEVRGDSTANNETVLKERNPNFKVLAENDHELLILNREEVMAKLSLVSIRAKFYPSLDLSGSIYKYGESNSFDRDKWNIGLTLSIPLFDGFSDLNRNSAQVQSLVAISTKRESLKASIELNIREDYDNLMNSQQKLKVDELFKAATVLRADVARKKYNNGLMTFEEWDQVEGDLISRERNVLISRKEYSFELAKWKSYDVDNGVIND